MDCRLTGPWRCCLSNHRKGATILRKVLGSAVANAVENNEADRRSVARQPGDGGTAARRCAGRRPRARGRADLILKPTSHVTVAVVEEEQE